MRSSPTSGADAPARTTHTSRDPSAQGPVRLAIVNDYEIIVAGLAAMLEDHRDRVHVVEINAQTPVLSDVDVVLVDTFGQLPRDGAALKELIRDSSAPVVLFSWELPPEAIATVAAAGAAGYLSKSLKAKEIVDALEAIRDGEIVVRTNSLTAGSEVAWEAGWPGRVDDLSPREAEVLAFITQGLTNPEIARNLYLTVNSVKSYIRAAYRKIGVTRRSQAVVWGMQHGFAPDSMRRFDPDAAPPHSEARSVRAQVSSASVRSARGRSV